jgi:hypothetical protein
MELDHMLAQAFSDRVASGFIERTGSSHPACLVSDPVSPGEQ